MKKINLFIILVMALCANAQAINLNFSTGLYLPINDGVESNWAARAEIRTCEDLWLGLGIENGQRQYVIELYEYTFYSVSARYKIKLTDKLSTSSTLLFIKPSVQDKGLTTKEAFMYLAKDEIPSGPTTFYDRVDVLLDPGFGAEISLDYKISKHFDFFAGYRLLKLEEHLLGYGIEAGQPRNYWRERKVDFSAFMFGIVFKW